MPWAASSGALGSQQWMTPVLIRFLSPHHSPGSPPAARASEDAGEERKRRKRRERVRSWGVNSCLRAHWFLCALDTILSVSVHVCWVLVWAPMRVRECITVTSCLCLSEISACLLLCVCPPVSVPNACVGLDMCVNPAGSGSMYVCV